MLPRALRILVSSYLLLASLLEARPSPAQQQEPEPAAKVVPPAPLITPGIEYPEGATGDGQVVLLVTVDSIGRVHGATVESGSEPFRSAALAGVSQWRFEPATRGGVPVSARILVKIDFPEPRAAIAASGADPLGSNQSVDIVVLGDRAEIGTTFIPVEEARNVPGAFADPFRAAAAQPGVAPFVSGLPYFFVRGAPPGNVGYLLDGIRVPFLFHVGAGPSVIAPALVERVDLFPSAYPAKLGRYAGGILAGTTRPLSPGARGEAQARVFDASAMIEQPIGRLSVLGAGRVSYMQPVLDIVAPDYRAEYWDYQARMGYRLDSKNEVGIFGFGASDLLANETAGAKLFDATFHRLDLRWNHKSETDRIQVAIGLGQDSIFAEETEEVGNKDASSQFESRGANVRIDTDHKLSDSIRVRGGIDYRIDEIKGEVDQGAFNEAAPEDRTDLQTATYLDFVFEPLSGLELVPGVRLETGLWRNSGYLYPEPRLATRLRLGSNLAWSSSLGMVHQLPTNSVRGPGIIPRELTSQVQEATQVAQSLEFLLPADIVGHTTAFFSWVRSRGEESLSARNYGLEVFLRRDLTKNVGFLVSYTLSRSEDSNESETFLSEFDKPHSLTAALSLNLGAGIRLGARGYISSGRTYRVRCPDAECSPSPADPDPELDVTVTGRHPLFIRGDFRLERRWEFSSGAWLTLAAEWFNATRTDESYDVNYDPALGKVFVVQDAVNFPSINLELGY